MTPLREMPQASGPRPKSVVDDAIAALAIWSVAVQSDREFDGDFASDLQVAAAAIDASLEPAIDTPCLDFLYGRLLVRMMDSALWNYAALAVKTAPPRDALVVTARMATDFLRRASMAFEHAEGGVQ